MGCSKFMRTGRRFLQGIFLRSGQHPLDDLLALAEDFLDEECVRSMRPHVNIHELSRRRHHATIRRETIGSSVALRRMRQASVLQRQLMVAQRVT